MQVRTNHLSSNIHFINYIQWRKLTFKLKQDVMGNINFKAIVIHFQNKKNKTTTLIALFSATEKPILVKQCSFDRSVKMSINTQIRNKRAFFLSTEERCTPYDAKMSKIKQEPYSTLIRLE